MKKKMKVSASIFSDFQIGKSGNDGFPSSAKALILIYIQVFFLTNDKNTFGFNYFYIFISFKLRSLCDTSGATFCSFMSM